MLACTPSFDRLDVHICTGRQGYPFRCLQYNYQHELKTVRVPAPEDLKNSRLFKAFSFNNSRPIQGLLPVDHSITYNPAGLEKKHTNLKHSCMTFINNKRSKQFFYPLNSNCGRKFSQSPSQQVLLKVSHRQIPNFSRPSTCFPKQFKDFFSFRKFKDFSRLDLNSRPAQEPWTVQKQALRETQTLHAGCGNRPTNKHTLTQTDSTDNSTLRR